MSSGQLKGFSAVDRGRQSFGERTKVISVVQEDQGTNGRKVAEVKLRISTEMLLKEKLDC